MSILLQFPVYFYDGCFVSSKKIVFAATQREAALLALCIARHDKSEWGCPITFDRVDVGIPIDAPIEMLNTFVGHVEVKEVEMREHSYGNP